MDRQAGVLVAGVAVEAERKRMLAGDRAKTQQAVRDGDARRPNTSAAQLRIVRAAEQHPLPGDDHAAGGAAQASGELRRAAAGSSGG